MNKSKKILFLLHLPPPVHGSSIVGLSIKESVLINKTFDCSYINLLASQNVAETGKFNLRKIYGFIITFAKTFISLVKKRPQLCYLALSTTGAAFYKDLLLVALLKIFKINRVYHLHNKGISLHQHKTFNKICYRFVFKGAEVILLSKYLYADIHKFVPLSLTHICSNGIPDECQGEEKIVQGAKYFIQILFLSNLINSKGVFVLLEACSLLKKRKMQFKCVFIGGEGDLTASQFNQWVVQLGLIHEVHYQGKKYGNEKRRAFLESDIFALPTYNECFPLVLLEAMSYSMPIVSTIEGGIPDIVEDGISGFLVPQRDAEALAVKLELLIKNPDLRKQMGEVGRRKYEQKFTLEIFEKKIVQILQEVIDKK